MAINDAGMFTVKEINRLKILQDIIDRNIRPRQAAEMLGITPRHCSRLLKCYRQYGPLGMNNQSRGRTGNRLLPASLTDQAACSFFTSRSLQRLWTHTCRRKIARTP